MLGLKCPCNPHVYLSQCLGPIRTACFCVFIGVGDNVYMLMGACGGQQWVASAGAVEHGCQRPNSRSLQEASVLNYLALSPAPRAVFCGEDKT